MTFPTIPEKTRAYIYRVLIAVFSILILYGVITGEEAAQWAFLLATILGLGESVLATKNTSIK